MNENAYRVGGERGEVQTGFLTLTPRRDPDS